MPIEEFFEERLEQSEVKTTIVTKYFSVWSQIMIRNLNKYGGDRIAYIDLFCGPGRYQDGSPSTPLMIIEQATGDEQLSRKLVTLFVDKNQGFVDSLQNEMGKMPNIDTLTYQPTIRCVETDEALAEFFEAKKIFPTLLFLDPCGYKGVTLRLIKSVLQNWGCDCIVFFNYNRINPGLDNPAVKGHMDNLFGEERAGQLRKDLRELSPVERELSIVNEFSLALQEVGGEYVLPFCFKRADGRRTSHYLIFVSKHVLGYKKMKEIMAACGSDKEQGVPTFQYTPAGPQQQLLFQLARPLDDLEGMLLDEFQGQSLRMKDVFEKHHVGKPYLERNYKEVLISLESIGRITADPPMDKRPKRQGKPTFGDAVWVSFPAKGEC